MSEGRELTKLNMLMNAISKEDIGEEETPDFYADLKEAAWNPT